ncbi:two-component system response regulator [Pontibacter locisalis]|uniref:Two-component system response regulator n=1 Tax=Pontibacter locisalis TaxID=1719035 RepID=A0ABW5IQD4_9BACT
MKTFIIDDDPISSCLTEMVLKLEGFTENTLTFSSAEESLDFLAEDMKEHLPKVIFLDLNMPTMNGWQFLQALKPHESVLTQDCAIYILTSSIDPAERRRAKEYGVVRGFISKPLTEEHLLNIKQDLHKVV